MSKDARLRLKALKEDVDLHHTVKRLSRMLGKHKL